jgi:hypothetical protein
VKRLMAGLAVLVLAALAAACGQSGPAVTVAWAPDAGTSGVYSGTLTPHGSPSGVIALKVVHDGGVKTIARYRFRALEGPGSARVTATGRAIDTSWSLPGSGAGPKAAHAAIPRRLRGSGASWSGSTVGPHEMGEEETVWSQERALGSPPSGDGLVMGSFAALVRESVQYPRRTVYCLTLDVEAQ